MDLSQVVLWDDKLKLLLHCCGVSGGIKEIVNAQILDETSRGRKLRKWCADLLA